MDFRAGQTLLFDKAKGWTSFDVVNKVRGMLRRQLGKLKVGHAGTLDPLATGLLVLCTGAATRGIEQIQAQEKTYEAVIRFGAVTASYDAEFPESGLRDISQLNAAAIEAALPAFTGEILQIPPVFSAVKVGGKRAYAAARAGKSIELQARPVKVYAFELIDYAPEKGLARARIRCSKGTYIRSLAHDLGQQLGTGAYLYELRRTAIGDFRVEDAMTVEAFAKYLEDMDAQA